MRILLEENLAPCTSLDAVLAQTQQTLAELHHEDGLLIHYVAGPISCDGDEHIPANLRLLEDARTDVMRTLPKGSIAFTAPFIFTPDVYSRLELFAMERTEREAAMQDFWDTLILSGLIAGIHFRQGWERSPGARREHQTALGAAVAVAYLDV